MAAIWIYTLLSVAFVSAISLVGIAAISFSERTLQQVVFISVSLAAGAMFGDAFIHILPGSFASSEHATRNASYVLSGILAFFVLEKFLQWRHSHIVSTGSSSDIRPVGYLNLVADAIHNLLDGLLLGAAYTAGFSVGLATTIAIVLHEIPQELSDFGVLLHAGFTRRRALLFNFVSGLLAIAGAIASLIVSQWILGFTEVMLPFTAGGFIYIAGSDLLPELHKERRPARSALQFAGLICGVGLMYLLILFE